MQLLATRASKPTRTCQVNERDGIADCHQAKPAGGVQRLQRRRQSRPHEVPELSGTSDINKRQRHGQHGQRRVRDRAVGGLRAHSAVQRGGAGACAR